LVRDLSMNPSLVERWREQATPPPVTLHQADLKTTYNVQTAFAAWFYLNVLTLRATPQRVLERLQRIAARSLRRVLVRLAGDFARSAPGQPVPSHLHEGNVWTYAELLAAAHATRGVGETTAMLESIRAACPAGMDAREATLCMVQGLWEWSRLRAPAVVIAFAPPFYPHVAASDGPLERAIHTVAERHAAEGVVLREFFPLLSDLSYMKLDRSMRTGALIANMPLWRDEPDLTNGMSYSLPFSAIKRAQIAGMANIGVYGQGAHQRGERVYMPYSFQTVPQMIFETILELEGE
jgi:arginine utilization protein RocB